MFSKIKGAVFLSASDSISKFIVFILLPFIALHFDANSLNSYLFNLLFFQLLSVVFLNSLNNLIVIDVINMDEDHYKKAFSNYLNAILFMFTVGTFFYSLISYIFFGDLILGILISCSALSNSLVIFILAYARAKKIFNPIAYLLIQKFFLILIINLFLLPEFPYEHFLFLITGIVNTYVVIRSLKIFQLKFSLSPIRADDLRNPLTYGFSLIPHTFSNWLRGSADKFFVYSLFSGTILSSYLIAYQYASYVIVFFTILSQMIQPFIFELLRNNNSKFFSYFISYVLLTFVITISSYFFIKFFINYFFEESYRTAIDFIGIMLIGVFFQALYFYLSHHFIYFKKNLFLSKTSIFVSLYIIGTGFLLAKYIPSLIAFCILFISAPIMLFLICLYNSKNTRIAKIDHAK